MRNKVFLGSLIKVVLCILVVLYVPFNSDKNTIYAETTVNYRDGSKIVTVSEKEFLQKYGCDKQKVFYTGYDENGELAVKLYFNPKTKKGCGISYHHDITCGFVIDGKDEYTYSKTQINLRDKYSLIPQQDIFDMDEKNISWKSYLKKNFKGFKENRKYKTINKKKRLACVTVSGKIPDEPDLGCTDIIKIEFHYNKNGRLLSKEVSLSYMYFFTTESYYANYYDSLGRLYYRKAYITHGDIQYMFLYDKNKKNPKYVLLLDSNLDMTDGKLIKIVK